MRTSISKSPEKSGERTYNEKNINKGLLFAQEAIVDEKNCIFKF